MIPTLILKYQIQLIDRPIYDFASTALLLLYTASTGAKLKLFLCYKDSFTELGLEELKWANY